MSQQELKCISNINLSHKNLAKLIPQLDYSYYCQEEMRFKINSCLPTLTDSHPLEQENPNNSQSTYISRGQSQGLSSLLRGLQALILGSDQEQEENYFFMMQMDEEMGSISIGFIRRNNKQTDSRYQPNHSLTQLAIQQYQQSQRNLSYALRQNLQKVKKIRQFYDKGMLQAKNKSIIECRNKAIMNLLSAGVIQPELQLKNRTFSQDTVDSLQLQSKKPKISQKQEQKIMVEESWEERQLEFQQFEMGNSH